MDPYDKTPGRARSEARDANVARVAGAAAVIKMVRAAKRAQEQAQAELEAAATNVKASIPQPSSKPASKLPPAGQAEARMLRDMFQAVFPDMKGISGATRVAAYSGSLTLSLAFAGFVYWAATRYDKAAGQQDNSSGSSASPT